MSETTIHLLSRERHGERYWLRAQSYDFARTVAAVPVAALELPRLVGHLPLALTARGEGYRLVALLGVEPGTNAFVDARGRWRGGHVPSALSTYPFRLIEHEGRYVLGIDEAQLTDDPYAGGEALYTEEGEPAATVQRSIDFLRRVARSRLSVDRALEALSAEGVIERWPAQVKLGGKPRRLGGLYRVSERALNALEPEALGRLRDAGALGIAYAQLLSVQALKTLEQAVAAREQEQRAQLPAGAVFSDAPLEDRIDWDALDFGDDAGERD
ncbi:SapC family protein [Halorhodospira halochloris]|uniref:SapC family protein n=1 Tax=Halorhodospira halochloris TaxID=1052 RepID=UPI001EE8E10B|nr:SapC family protein [Halorhodospira halochloris]MCG5531443.1 SapC family protein [Halorhodospira halochloris]